MAACGWSERLAMAKKGGVPSDAGGVAKNEGEVAEWLVLAGSSRSNRKPVDKVEGERISRVEPA